MFTHLHLHTQYSFLDGLCQIDQLIGKAKESGLTHLCMTDHGTLAGMPEFVEKCHEAKIVPVVGCELYVKSREGKRNHLTVIAKSREGVKSLCRMLSTSENFNNRPFVPIDSILENNREVIVLSGCFKSPFATLLFDEGEEKSRELLEEFARVFKDDFYIELMHVFHKADDKELIEKEKRLNDFLKEFALRKGIIPIATNDCHYLNPEDNEIHNKIVKAQMHNMGKKDGFDAKELYFKSREEMKELFSDLPESVDHVADVLSKVKDDIVFDKSIKIPKLSKIEKDFRTIVFEKAKEKYGNNIPYERIEFELNTIEKLEIADYFLIVKEIIDTAKEHGIFVSPGRGSAAGSVVCYCLGITAVDPLKYNLSFERFLNPDRVSMPDVDIDIEHERRDELIEILKKRWGEERIARICNLNFIKGKMALKKARESLELGDYQTINSVTKNLDPDFSIEGSEETLVKMLVERKMPEDEARKIVEFAKILNSRPANVSIHAGGVVITTNPLTDELIPLTGEGVTQFDKNIIEDLGYLKVDLLASKYATLVKILKEKTGVEPDVEDPKIYSLLREGWTAGIMQMGGRLIKNMLIDFQVEKFEDVVLINALNRPGPLQTGIAKECIKKRREELYKQGKISSPYFWERRYEMMNIEENEDENGEKFDPSVFDEYKDILQETYGFVVYQEQIIEIAKRVGLTPSQADELRKAIGKKKIELIEKYKDRFDPQVFKALVRFGRYCFNKSHSVAYSWVSMATAYYKYYFEEDFYNAAIEIFEDRELENFYTEFAERNFEIVYPDLNRSPAKTVVKDKKVFVGLDTISGLSETVAQSIVSERNENGPYESVEDFVKRMESWNKRIKDLKEGQPDLLSSEGSKQKQQAKITKGYVKKLLKAGCLSKEKGEKAVDYLRRDLKLGAKKNAEVVAEVSSVEKFLDDSLFSTPNPVYDQLKQVGLWFKRKSIKTRGG